MKTLSSRRFAVAVFVVVALVFSLLGCHRSLTKACEAVEASFYQRESGSDGGYYSCPGEQLEYCVKYANRLLSVLNGHVSGDVYDALGAGRTALADAMDAGDISDVYDANTALVAAVDAAEAAAEGLDLSDSSDDYDSILSDFRAAEKEAADSAYNQRVDTFLREVANQFPTSILRRAAFVDMPEKYQ